MVVCVAVEPPPPAHEGRGMVVCVAVKPPPPPTKEGEWWCVWP